MNDGLDSLRRIVGAVNSNKGAYPALSLVRNSPETAAVISKLIRGRDLRRFDKNDTRTGMDMDQSRMQEISHTVTERITDAENMVRLFPDLELAQQILISSILSPKDMVNTEIIYGVAGNLIPSELVMKITEEVQKHCEDEYKLKTMLPDILREMLFENGSYVRAVIPEAAIDELINSRSFIAVEHLKGLVDPTTKQLVGLGFLGEGQKKTITLPEQQKQRTALEVFGNFEPIPYQHYEAGVVAVEGENKFDMRVEVTDNFHALKLPALFATQSRAKAVTLIGRSSRTRDQLARRLSQEDMKQTAAETKPISARRLENMIYKNNQTEAKPFVSVKTTASAARKSIGRPLNMKLPSEATIPVHVPGDPKHHIGYFILIDEEGNPITKNSNLQYFSPLQAGLSNQSHGMSSYLLQKARTNLIGLDSKQNLSIDQAARVYADIVESDLVERLRSGIYGANVKIGRSEEVYRIMLARTFANQFTRLVYVPVELVTYFAYKYYDNGLGKSMLDDLKVITSLRAILMFAKVMAMTKNSIALTHVNMTLDPNDPDPQKTIEMSVHEVMKMRQQYFPLGINSPLDLVDWIQRAGFEFSFEGHPGIPQTKFDFETKQLQHTLPDNDLDELLRKQTFMAMGLSPETVDNGFSAEFATTIVQNNILLSKRVLQIQEVFTPQVADHVKKICQNDMVLFASIVSILREHKESIDKYLADKDKSDMQEDETQFLERLAYDIIDNLTVDLPKPDITTLENQSTAYEHYSESLDKAIDAWISSDFVSDNVAGDISSSIDTIKATLKAYFLRQWMAQNGYMSELADIIALNDDGNPKIELATMMEDHVKSLMRGSVKYIASLNKMKQGANTDLGNLGATNDETSSSGSDTGDTGGDMGGGGDDFGMGGDFGIGGDLGGGDTGDTTGGTGDETGGTGEDTAAGGESGEAKPEGEDTQAGA